MGSDAAERLLEAAQAAHRAERAGDGPAANEAWRCYRLIRDAARDPDELLAEGMALSAAARRVAEDD